MALHFEREEYAARLDKLTASMREEKLDAMLLFAQESMYWLTGYDTFGYCFFQCMIVSAKGDVTLLTRAPDLRQAQHTSIVEDIRIWRDHGKAQPEKDHQTRRRRLIEGFLTWLAMGRQTALGRSRSTAAPIPLPTTHSTS